jgi:uncharacterized protein (DUF1800 family)
MSSSKDAWAPFQPTADNPWDLAKVAHLHRRAGFGATWAELQRDVREGPVASIDRFLNPRPSSAEETQILAGLRQGVLASRDAERLKAWWLYRVIYDADPLREKMTLFWHSHFATSNRKVQSVPLMLQQNETLRRHALGNWSDLLCAIVADPAMLLWLDGAESRRGKPNENFAREFLELFTLGVGHYTEPDVRAAARAFTGWVRTPGDVYDPETPARYSVDPAQFDDGTKTFLGQTGAWKAEDIVRIVLEQRPTAEFLCRRLYRFLVSEGDEPTGELLGPLVDEFRAHQYSVHYLLGVILRSRHFYERSVRRKRIKSPVEWSAELIRSLEVPRSDVSLLALAAACERQGQDLFYPPNVKGWDGGKAWLNSGTLLARMNWATDVIFGNPDLAMKPLDTSSWTKRYGISEHAATARLVDLVLQGDANSRSRAQIAAAGQDGTPESLRLALQLIVHCPESQLA